MSNDPTRADVLVAIRGIEGDIATIREIMVDHVIKTQKDHENRIRENERSIQRGKGAIGLLTSGFAIMVAVGGWIVSIIEKGN